MTQLLCLLLTLLISLSSPAMERNAEFWCSSFAAKSAGQLGREGEALSGIVGPKVRIPSATGTAQYRVPDQLTSEFLKDAKNVGELRWTPQLTDFGEHAAQNNLRYLIDVRQNTIIGPRAQQMIDQYWVEINRLYPPR
jgi:hypothetical protein